MWNRGEQSTRLTYSRGMRTLANAVRRTDRAGGPMLQQSRRHGRIRSSKGLAFINALSLVFVVAMNLAVGSPAIAAPGDITLASKLWGGVKGDSASREPVAVSRRDQSGLRFQLHQSVGPLRFRQHGGHLCEGSRDRSTDPRLHVDRRGRRRPGRVRGQRAPPSLGGWRPGSLHVGRR